MKMAENSVVLAFQNNCEAINSNCVEVTNEAEEKIANNDEITETNETNINKPEDEPSTNDNINGTAQEDAVDKFLAGDHKNEFNDDSLLENIETENDGIVFKSDNVISDCPEMEKGVFFDADVPEEEPEDDGKGETTETETPTSPAESTEEHVETENVESLTKMQIMEDVREGCSIQPSSPGHAEERINNSDSSKPEVTENGFDEEPPTQDEDSLKKEEEPKEDDDKLKIENGDDANKVDANNTHDDSSSNSSEEPPNMKRKSENQDNSTKRLRLDIQENYIKRDKILNDFIEIVDCNTTDQLQLQTEQILAEIRTLNELAREKEREWNNIIHLKKMKEELLLRMQRRKQVMLLNGEKSENGDVSVGESQSDGERIKGAGQSILKTNLSNKNMRSMSKHRSLLPKPQNFTQDMNGSDYRQNKQRPVLDVQSIIADYRQRHPETVPRRGRRIRNMHDSKSSILNFSSLALGSGAQVQQNDVNNDLGLLLNAIEANRNDSRPSSAESTAEPSFKDMLVQFAKLSQSERNELIQNAIKPPPPYPEVTVHPVPTTTTVAPTNSLLHGILTKSPTKANTKTSFSPTLARLLTAPERANSHAVAAATISNSLGSPGNMSISEILSTSKARNEITITPVGTQFESTPKNKSMGNADEDEAEDSADRLVIDESTEALEARARGENSSDGGDEVPQCQGCNQKSALFVCAGCGNQWYCSRDCQVNAWDEHSEVCSG